MGLKKIVVFGEILFDFFVEEGYEKLGGAPFNFAFHLNALLGNVSLISSLGLDDRGERALAFLKTNKLDTKYIELNNKYPTGLVEVEVNKEGVPFYNIKEEVAYDYIQWSKGLEALSTQQIDLFYFGILAQREKVSADTLKKFIYKSQPKIIFCDLNLRPNCYNQDNIESSLKICNFLKINQEELIFLNKKKRFGIANEEIIRNLADEYELKYICLTKGEKGSIFFVGGKFFYALSIKNKIINTVGAGDAYAAKLAAEVLLNSSPARAVESAAEFASAICALPGAIPDNNEWYQQIKIEELI